MLHNAATLDYLYVYLSTSVSTACEVLPLHLFYIQVTVIPCLLLNGHGHVAAQDTIHAFSNLCAYF